MQACAVVPQPRLGALRQGFLGEYPEGKRFFRQDEQDGQDVLGQSRSETETDCRRQSVGRVKRVNLQNWNGLALPVTRKPLLLFV